MFGDLRARTEGFELERRVEHAAATLVALVVDRTGADDAWYATFATFLGWFVETCGIVNAREAIHAVARGAFESWCALSPEAVAAAAIELGRVVVAPEPSPVRDELSAWLAVRAQAFVHAPNQRPRRAVTGDGHTRYIATRDHARDPERARRMTAALAACRKSAMKGEPLTLERLTGWQKTLLGSTAAPLRITDAFARGGAVRYAFSSDLQARVRDALTDANGHDPTSVRAARVFLDLCFMHPFADGNGRAARLALDHVITRAGLGLHAAEPLFVIARRGDDLSGAFRFAWMVDVLAGPRP